MSCRMPKGKEKPRIGKFATVITAIASPSGGGGGVEPHQAQSPPNDLSPGRSLADCVGPESSTPKLLNPDVKVAGKDIGVPLATGKKKNKTLMERFLGYFRCGKPKKAKQATLTNHQKAPSVTEEVDNSQQEAEEKSGEQVGNSQQEAEETSGEQVGNSQQEADPAEQATLTNHQKAPSVTEEVDNSQQKSDELPENGKIEFRVTKLKEDEVD